MFFQCGPASSRSDQREVSALWAAGELGLPSLALPDIKLFQRRKVLSSRWIFFLFRFLSGNFRVFRLFLGFFSFLDFLLGFLFLFFFFFFFLFFLFLFLRLCFLWPALPGEHLSTVISASFSLKKSMLGWKAW